MDRYKLRLLAKDAVNNYFSNVDSIINNIVAKVVDAYKIEDADDIKFLKEVVTRGILNWEPNKERRCVMKNEIEIRSISTEDVKIAQKALETIGFKTIEEGNCAEEYRIKLSVPEKFSH